MVLEGIWGDTCSRTIDFRGLPECGADNQPDKILGGLWFQRALKKLSLARNPFPDQPGNLGIAKLFVREGSEVHHEAVRLVLP
jgi:hypothetical protein